MLLNCNLYGLFDANSVRGLETFLMRCLSSSCAISLQSLLISVSFEVFRGSRDSSVQDLCISTASKIAALTIVTVRSIVKLASVESNCSCFGTSSGRKSFGTKMLEERVGKDNGFYTHKTGFTSHGKKEDGSDVS